MTKNPKHLLRELRDISLSDASFMRIREAIASYADLHTAKGGSVSPYIASPFARFIRSPRTAYAFVAVFMVATGGGGVALASDTALPGDFLYPVKVEMAEKFSAAFILDPEERAKNSAKLAERRADEAIKLADEGRLDAENAAYLATEFEAHITDSVEGADALEAEGDLSASLAVRTDLEKRISLRATTLNAILAEDEPELVASADSEVAGAELADTIDEQATSIAMTRMHAEAAILPGIVNEEGETYDLLMLRAPANANAKLPIFQAADTDPTIIDAEATTTLQSIINVDLTNAVDVVPQAAKTRTYLKVGF